MVYWTSWLGEYAFDFGTWGRFELSELGAMMKEDERVLEGKKVD